MCVKNLPVDAIGRVVKQEDFNTVPAQSPECLFHLAGKIGSEACFFGLGIRQGDLRANYSITAAIGLAQCLPHNLLALSIPVTSCSVKEPDPIVQGLMDQSDGI